MEKKNENKIEKIELSGEELLQEYFSQDKDDKHNMGYGVYGQTSNSSCCC